MRGEAPNAERRNEGLYSQPASGIARGSGRVRRRPTPIGRRILCSAAEDIIRAWRATQSQEHAEFIASLTTEADCPTQLRGSLIPSRKRLESVPRGILLLPQFVRYHEPVNLVSNSK
jgi:hypothetical protein